MKVASRTIFLSFNYDRTQLITRLDLTFSDFPEIKLALKGLRLMTNKEEIELN